MTTISRDQYSYSMKEDQLPSPSEVRKIGKQMGKSINPAYEDPEAYTPHKIGNAVLFGLTAGTAVLCLPIALILGGATLLNYFSDDYNSPGQRRQIIQRIANESFEKIHKGHNTDDIIGYSLFNNVSVIQDWSSEQRDFFYGLFKKLAEEYDRLKDWRLEEESKIMRIWSKETQVKHPLSDKAMAEIMRPWNRWRDGEIDKIQAVCDDVINCLENKFSELKKAEPFLEAYSQFEIAKKSEGFLSKLF